MKNSVIWVIIFYISIFFSNVTTKLVAQILPISYLSDNELNTLYERDITTNPNVGTLKGIVDVSPNGAASYTIQLFVPPGTAGIQPSISLVYNSQAGNGIMGVGWNTTGMSAITRVQQTWYNDGNVQPINHSWEDRFELDGNRLIAISNIPGISTTYRTELETFSNIVAYDGQNEPDRFEIHTKEGSTLFYGQTPDAKIEGSNCSSQKTITWLLKKVMDSNGNYYDYYYNKTTDNEAYIDRIEYTKNNNSPSLPFNTIRFNYGIRTDVSIFYQNGCMLTKGIIINSIDMISNQDIVKKYTLHYSLKDFSHLVKITEVSKISPEMAYNSTLIKWGTETLPIENITSMDNDIKQDILIGDFNGDGLSDVFSSEINDDYQTGDWWRVFTSQGNTNPSSFSFNNWTGEINDYDNMPISTVVDINSDGVSDIIVFTTGYAVWNCWYAWISTKDNYNNYTSFTKFCFVDDLLTGSKAPLFGDFNGDGKKEGLFYNSGEYKIVGFFGGINISGQVPYYWDNAYPLDFDGDGLTEILNVTTYGNIIYKLINNQLIPILNNQNFNTDYNISIGDFNGDGKDDIVYFHEDNQNIPISIALSNGLTFEPPKVVSSIFSNSNFSKYRLFVQDFNGDGFSDILQIIPRDNNCYNEPGLNGGTVYYFTHDYYMSYSLGNGYFNTTLIISELTSKDNNDKCFHFGDFNGDGKTDLYYTYYYDDHHQQPSEIFYFCRDEKKHYPEYIKDGFDFKTEFNFTSLSKSSNYLRESNAIFPMIDWNGSLFVTSAVRIPNGIGQTNVTTYNYSGLKIHLQGKGILGFKKFEVTNNTTNIRTTNTYTIISDYFYKALENSLTEHIQEGSISEISNRWYVHDYGNTRYFPYIGHQTSTDFLKLHSVSSDFTINQDGNTEVSIIEYTSSDGQNLIQDEIVKTFNSYNYFGNNFNTIPNRITKSITEQWKNNDVFTSISVFDYDPKGNLKLEESKNPSTLSNFIEISYDRSGNPFGLVSKVTKKSPQLPNQDSYLIYKYDQYAKFVEQKINTEGHKVFDCTFDPKTGNIITSKDISGNLTSYHYDNFGKPIKTVIPQGNTINNDYKWALSSIPNSVYKLIISSTGKPPLTSFHDLFDREIQSETPAFTIQGPEKSIIITTEYDQIGFIERKSMPYFSNDPQNIKWKFYKYDTFGRLTKETFENQFTTYTYQDSKTVIIGPDGNSSSKRINSIGKLIKSSDNGGTIKYEYNAAGDVRFIDVNGIITEMVYDPNSGRQTEIHDPDAGISLYQYNDYNQLELQQDALGNIYIMSYDVLGRIKDKTHINTGEITSFGYNPVNELPETILVNNVITNEFTYDQLNRLKTETKYIDNIPFVTKYDYLPNSDDLEYLTYPSSYKIKYEYNNQYGYLSGLKTSIGSPLWTRGEETADGLPISEILDQNIICQYSFNEFNQIENISMGNQFHYSFNYNSQTGNLNSRSNLSHQVPMIESFQYDNLHRLKSIQNGNGIPIVIEYEDNGNITKKEDIGLYEYDPVKPHAVARLTCPVFLPPKQHITYTPFNSTESIIQDEYLLNIAYGSNAQRQKTVLQKFINGSYTTLYTRYYTEKFEKETTLSGTRNIHYIYNNNRLISVYISPESNLNNGTLYYICPDHQGSIMGLLNTTGTLVEEYSYDAWGKRRNALNWSSSVTVPFILYRGYTGHEHLDEFELINMNGRMYDPSIGRFLSPDNIIQTPDITQNYNRYSYCLNNPLIFTDPTGNYYSDNFYRKVSSRPYPSENDIIAYSGEVQSDRFSEISNAPSAHAIFELKAWQYQQGMAMIHQKRKEWYEITLMMGFNPHSVHTSSSSSFEGKMWRRAFSIGKAILGIALFALPIESIGYISKLARTESVIILTDAKIASAAAKIGANGRQYSVAYEAKLAGNLYPGKGYYSHFRAANVSLSNDMVSDAVFSNSISKLGITIPRYPTGNIKGVSPDNWVWHHDVDIGVLQLVPKAQHTNGSIFWNTMHPGGFGGMAIWGW